MKSNVWKIFHRSPLLFVKKHSCQKTIPSYVQIIFCFFCITGEYIFWGGGRSTFFARFTLRVYFFCISADDAAAGWLLLMVVLLLTLPCCCCWLPGAGSCWSSTTTTTTTICINIKLRHGIKRRMNPFGHDGKHHLFTLRLVWLANVCLLVIQSCKAS